MRRGPPPCEVLAGLWLCATSNASVPPNSIEIVQRPFLTGHYSPVRHTASATQRLPRGCTHRRDDPNMRARTASRLVRVVLRGLPPLVVGGPRAAPGACQRSLLRGAPCKT